MSHRIITYELMKRNFFVPKEHRNKIIAMGQDAMERYKKALQDFNTAGYLYLYRNPKLMEKTTIQYHILNLN